MAQQQIKVLVVEDSNVLRLLLVHILNSDPQIRVIGTASNGQEAINFVTDNPPDIIVMDIQMPHMDGLEATRRIMETRPVPIIICSGSSVPRESMTQSHLMEAGAVAYVHKPRAAGHANYKATVASLLQTVKLMSEVKVVRRWPQHHLSQPLGPKAIKGSSKKIEMVGIGASTGGPPVIQMILTGLPRDLPVPILVVQHIAHGFLGSLCDWLKQTTQFQVEIAANDTIALPGHVYFAPDDFHISIHAGRIILSKEKAEENLRPSVSHLFRSLADSYGPSALGVLLTGMGKDGAAELKHMKDRGAVTIVQDQKSSVVHGMPGEAIALDAATYILPDTRIAGAMLSLIKRQPMTDTRLP